MSGLLLASPGLRLAWSGSLWTWSGSLLGSSGSLLDWARLLLIWLGLISGCSALLNWETNCSASDFVVARASDVFSRLETIVDLEPKH